MKSRKIRIYLVTVLIMVVLLGLLLYFYVLQTEQPVMEGTMVQREMMLWTMEI